MYTKHFVHVDDKVGEASESKVLGVEKGCEATSFNYHHETFTMTTLMALNSSFLERRQNPDGSGFQRVDNTKFVTILKLLCHAIVARTCFHYPGPSLPFSQCPNLVGITIACASHALCFNNYFNGTGCFNTSIVTSNSPSVLHFNAFVSIVI